MASARTAHCALRNASVWDARLLAVLGSSSAAGPTLRCLHHAACATLACALDPPHVTLRETRPRDLETPSCQRPPSTSRAAGPPAPPPRPPAPRVSRPRPSATSRPPRAAVAPSPVPPRCPSPARTPGGPPHPARAARWRPRAQRTCRPRPRRGPGWARRGQTEPSRSERSRPHSPGLRRAGRQTAPARAPGGRGAEKPGMEGTWRGCAMEFCHGSCSLTASFNTPGDLPCGARRAQRAWRAGVGGRPCRPAGRTARPGRRTLRGAPAAAVRSRDAMRSRDAAGGVRRVARGGPAEGPGPVGPHEVARPVLLPRHPASPPVRHSTHLLPPGRTRQAAHSGPHTPGRTRRRSPSDPSARRVQRGCEQVRVVQAGRPCLYDLVQQASLRQASLRQASLRQASLRQASLRQASLRSQAGSTRTIPANGSTAQHAPQHTIAHPFAAPHPPAALAAEGCP
jgi:hypothetical protein